MPRLYSESMFGAKKMLLNAAWYQRWNWLKFSVKLDAAFRFPACHKFDREARATRCESTFTRHGYRNLKHATEKKIMEVFPNIAPPIGMLQ